ncbi:MAG: D-alanyl-D-alanine carboxypeptidase [Clostridia bacterium]|nr:D-alanyl-D-alanine carboxypeptidase [Clostridia bacterium]
MKKKIFALILIFLFIFAVPAQAYQINEYELHHEAGMLISMDTGDVLYSKNADERMYPASITKLMSAVVMLENIDDLENEFITYTKTANDLILGTGSAIYNGDGLKVGEKMRASDALAALLISSSGDVAYAIAEHVGGTIDGFVDMMNEKAKEMGLANTHYTNPVGLHDDNLYTTARDISVLAKYAFGIDIVKELLSKTQYKMEATNFHKELNIYTSNLMISPNTNVYYRYAVCGKTGYTSKAGRCLVCIGSYNGYNYMSIVLNAKTPGGKRNEFIDTANMFRWAFNGFEYKTLLEDAEPVTEVPVALSSETDHLSLVFDKGLKALLPKEADASTVEYKIHLNAESFDAPIEKGEALGSADIYYAEEKLGTLQLVAARSVKANPLLVFARSAGNFFASTFMKVVYVILAGAIVIFAAIIFFMNIGRGKKRKVKYIPLDQRELDHKDDDFIY